MKRILMISQTVFPPDIRLEKEIKSLYQNGFVVNVLCNQYDKTKTPNYKYCSISRFNAIFDSNRLNKIINFPIFFNPRLLYKSVKEYLRFKPDFIHAHDLPMVPIALVLKMLSRVPVIFDMHENYPEALKCFKKKGIINYIFKNPTLSKKLEQVCLKFVNHVFVVVEESKERLVSEGYSAEKVSVVSNTVDLETFITDKKDETIEKGSKDRFTLVYTGTVSPERGLETPVEAMKFLKNELPEIKLLVIGDGKSVSKLKDIIKKYNLEEFVDLVSWPGHENLSKYISIADICIIPQPCNEFIDTTIPHKLFEYMFMSKPVLTSDAKSLKRIVEETGAGKSFISNNPRSFADNVIKMKKNFNQCGIKGNKAVKEKYNWKREEKVMLDVYNNFCLKFKD
ncbi:MAG: glycosyltransferase family 4 protein [Melioribacteraceae bacterium]|nr:glycosyltransferase family 4 protein [Melioribacteraceae bacterium]